MSGVKVNNGVTNYGGMPSGGGGLLANRPAAGVLGRIYIATDTLELYRDTGLVWTTIGGPGSGTVTGTGTVNEITFWNGAGSIGSLTTAVYPSLTELSYVKGVTSGIQTQINGKQDAIILTTSGTGGAATFIGNTLNVPQYQAALTNPVTGTGTVNEITFWNGAGLIGSLTTAVYPSLTELSYVKGVTSGIQTQINGKQDAIILTTSGTGGAATFIGNTLNVPQYQAALTNPVTGTGVSGQAAFWTGTNAISGDNAFHWDNVNKRLGINTVNPGVRLDIHGTGIIQQLNGTTTNNAYLDFQNAGSTQWRIGNFYNGAVNQFALFNAGGSTNVFTILQSGLATFSNSVIASSSTVGGSIGDVNNFIASNSSVINGNFTGYLFSHGAVNANTKYGYIGTVLTSVVTNGIADMVFGVKANTATVNITEYMRIQGGGNIGMGYTNPNVNLAVLGSIYQGTNTANALYEVFCNGNLYTGGLSPTILTVTGNTTMARTATGYRCTATLTLTLPAASGLNNIYYVIANTGATITVQRSGTDTILDKTGTSVTSVTILPGTRSMFYVGGGTETFQIF